MTVIPGDKRVYVVVQGRPSVWYPNENDGVNALRYAEEEAARKAEETHEDHTVLCIPIESLSFALVARYHGVVLHALDKLEEEEDDD